MKLKKILAPVIFAGALASPALAQWGPPPMMQGPTFIEPLGNGQIQIQQPGELPGYITPEGNNYFMIQRPGQLPQQVIPQAGGGFMIPPSFGPQSDAGDDE